jgi:tRNA A37 methylthiotransferase MiaB
MNSIDFVICSLPPLTLERPAAAPALLKSVAESAGYSAMGLDLNAEFYVNQCQSQIDKFNEYATAFRPYEKSSPAALEKQKEWVNDCIEIFKQCNPKVVGLSVFSNFQHRAAIALSSAIRQHLPKVKIVFGGYGLNTVGNTLKNFSLIDIKNIDMLKPLQQILSEKQLSDYIVMNDPLNNLVDILDKEIGQSRTLKLYEESKIMFNSPIPNYDDYKLDYYLWRETDRSLPVTGSKGCVRACTFCDVPGQFGKFKFRSGTDIAKEIIYLHQKYKVNTFEFTDSLVNGSLKSFREWLEILAEYNDTQEESNKIQWFGQYICRPQQLIPKDMYSLIKRSGVKNLVIGVESGSNEVLAAMKKGMTVEDVYSELDQFIEYGIQTHILMLSGFYNETWDRYLETLKFIVKCQHYVASGVITHISVGVPLFINNEMYLHQAADQLGIILDHNNDLNWVLRDDPENNFVERSKRRLITQLLLDKLEIPISENSITNMYQVLANLNAEIENG